MVPSPDELRNPSGLVDAGEGSQGRCCWVDPHVDTEQYHATAAQRSQGLVRLPHMIHTPFGF